MKIIVADDSLVMRKIISNLIKSMGFEYLLAVNGQEVLDLLGENYTDIDLILLDWNMPVMDGMETIVAMQSQSNYKDIPILMVSTESEDDCIDRAIRAGAKGYMAKPFTQEDLAAKIKKILS